MSRPAEHSTATAAASTSTGEAAHDDDFVPTDELVRRSGVKPFTSLDDLAPEHDPFESDDEYAEFLADLYVSRRTGVS